MTRSVFASLAVVALALLVALGCGGGGGGGGNGGSSAGGGTNGGSSASFAVLSLVGTAGGATTAPAQSLSNMVAGQTLIVRALTVERPQLDAQGALIPGQSAYVDVQNLSVDAPTSVASANPAFGTIVANDASTGSYTVTATVNGRSLSATLRVLPANRVQVSGRARSITNAGVAGATVSFYPTGSSDELASTLTGPTGNYIAYVPNDATRFAVDSTDLRTLSGAYLYHNTYAIGSVFYDATLNCPAPLPTLTANTALPEVVFYNKSSGASFPPDGCVQ